MKALIHDIQMCIHAAIQQWKFCRRMRQGGNPDNLPF